MTAKRAKGTKSTAMISLKLDADLLEWAAPIAAAIKATGKEPTPAAIAELAIVAVMDRHIKAKKSHERRLKKMEAQRQRTPADLEAEAKARDARDGFIRFPFTDGRGAAWNISFHKRSGSGVAHPATRDDARKAGTNAMALKVDATSLTEWNSLDISRMATPSVYNGGNTLNDVLTGGAA